MAKVKLKMKKGESLVANNSRQQEIIETLGRQLIATNALATRSALMSAAGIDSRRSINSECGYPNQLTIFDYQLMYDREGLATKVVDIFPEETWAVDPIVDDNNDPTETVFEKAWRQLEEDLQLYSFMFRLDKLSGIGRFGVMMLGIDDNKEFNEPVEGINDDGTYGKNKYNLIYVRVFSENNVCIKKVERDKTNPRYGQPTLYGIIFESSSSGEYAKTTDSNEDQGKELVVHWTRIIHFADNKGSSENFGMPRMQMLFNRLYDIRKIAGGSGEMFWKGGFPGLSFQIASDAKPITTAQREELETEIAAYADGLQRYLKLQGVEAKSLAPQIADPKNHIDVMITIISIALSIPKRIFQGSEVAKLASSQDAKNWNKRISRRQNKEITPGIVRPLIDRLIALGALPEVEDYIVEWPDMNSPSDLDKAEVTLKYVDAFAKYVNNGVYELIPEEEFFQIYTDLTREQIDMIKKAVDKRLKEEGDIIEEEQDAQQVDVEVVEDRTDTQVDEEE